MNVRVGLLHGLFLFDRRVDLELVGYSPDENCAVCASCDDKLRVGTVFAAEIKPSVEALDT
jgi:hypothetical protein